MQSFPRPPGASWDFDREREKAGKNEIKKLE